MITFFKPVAHTGSYRTIRVITVVLALLISQSLLSKESASANVVGNTYNLVSEAIAFDLGNKACGYLCAAVAVGTVATVNTAVPKVATKAVDYAKPGLFEMFTNWGSTFFRP